MYQKPLRVSTIYGAIVVLIMSINEAMEDMWKCFLRAPLFIF